MTKFSLVTHKGDVYFSADGMVRLLERANSIVEESQATTEYKFGFQTAIKELRKMLIELKEEAEYE